MFWHWTVNYCNLSLFYSGCGRLSPLKEQSVLRFMQLFGCCSGHFLFFTGSSRIFKVIRSFTVFYGVPPNGILANEGNGGGGCGSFRDNFLGLYFGPVIPSPSELHPKTVEPFEPRAFRLWGWSLWQESIPQKSRRNAFSNSIATPGSAIMSKFRARALDASRDLAVYRTEHIPDLAEYAAINRTVPQMPTGMEKEEETVSFGHFVNLSYGRHFENGRCIHLQKPLVPVKCTC